MGIGDILREVFQDGLDDTESLVQSEPVVVGTDEVQPENPAPPRQEPTKPEQVGDSHESQEDENKLTLGFLERYPDLPEGDRAEIADFFGNYGLDINRFYQVDTLDPSIATSQLTDYVNRMIIVFRELKRELGGVEIHDSNSKLSEKVGKIFESGKRLSELVGSDPSIGIQVALENAFLNNRLRSELVEPELPNRTDEQPASDGSASEPIPGDGEAPAEIYLNGVPKDTGMNTWRNAVKDPDGVIQLIMDNNGLQALYAHSDQNGYMANPKEVSEVYGVLFESGSGFVDMVYSNQGTENRIRIYENGIFTDDLKNIYLEDRSLEGRFTVSHKDK